MRWRCSTLVATPFYLSPAEIGLGKRESIADIARVLAGYVDVVMARTFDHEHVLELARWSTVPIVNGLTDYNHPCQAMADMLTVYEEFGKLEGLHMAYIGDSNNVTTSLMMAASQFGMKMTIVSPEGFQPKQSTIDKAKSLNSAFEIDVTRRSGCWTVRRRRGLHRHLDQHGPGRRSRKAPRSLPSLPGKRRTTGERGRPRHRHALLARPSRRRDH